MLAGILIVVIVLLAFLCGTLLVRVNALSGSVQAMEHDLDELVRREGRDDG